MLTLGSRIDDHSDVVLSKDDLVRHVALFGKSGTGKSTLLRSMFRDLVTGGAGIAVIDPHGNLVRDLLRDIPNSRIDDVVYLDLADPEFVFGINLFEATGDMSAAEKTQKVNQVKSIFRKVGGATAAPLIETWLPVLTHTFLDAGEGTFVEIPRILSDKTYRDRLTRHLQNNFSRFYWQTHVDRNGMVYRDEVDSTIRRFGKFLTNPLLEQIVGQEKTTIPFQEILNRNMILLVSLPNDDEDTTALLGTVIFQELFNATVKRQSDTPFAIIADECQLVTTPDLARFIDEARKRNVGIVLATQRVSKMEDDRVEEAMMNVGTLITLTVDYDDAVKLGRRFPGLTKPQEQYVALPQPMTRMSEVRQNGHPNPYVISLIRELDSLIKSHTSGQQISPDQIDLRDWRHREHLDRYDGLIEWHQTHTDPGRALGSALLTADMNYYHPELYQRSRAICLELYPLLQNEPILQRIKDYKPPPAAEQLQTLQATHGWGTAVVSIQGKEHLITIARAEESGDTGQAQYIIAASRARYYRQRDEVAAEIQRRLSNPEDDEQPPSIAPMPKPPKPPKPYDLPVSRRARKDASG